MRDDNETRALIFKVGIWLDQKCRVVVFTSKVRAALRAAQSKGAAKC